MHHHQLHPPVKAIEKKFQKPGAPDVVPRALAMNRSAKGIKPDFFIVGAPRCGTTAMNAYLAAHPDIFMAQKEMHCFGRDLQFGANFYRRGKREYFEEFAKWKGQLRIGESSVWYLFSKQAAAEIQAFNPNAQIIIMGVSRWN